MEQTVPEVKITPRQLEILRMIGEFQARQCYSATMAEVAQAAGVSRTTAFEHIASLRKKGLLVKSKGRARSLKLTSSGSRLLEYRSSLQDCGGREGVKLVGRVAAGVPIEAIENAEEISLRSVFGDGEDVFALEVRGDSMINEGIEQGIFRECDVEHVTWCFFGMLSAYILYQPLMGEHGGRRGAYPG